MLVVVQGRWYNQGKGSRHGTKADAVEGGTMHITYKPLWHTLIERDMTKEDLRIAAGLTSNMIANMGKQGKNIRMDTLARICETLGCGITDVIALEDDAPDGGA